MWYNLTLEDVAIVKDVLFYKKLKNQKTHPKNPLPKQVQSPT